jgi:hypothetical protein
MSILNLSLQATVIVTLLSTALNARAAAPLVSSQADQHSVALTIYNANLGLVKDRRSIAIPAGSSELRFTDVAAQIIPASVQISSREGGELRILEQNYEYDLLNPQKLMDKYVGKEVRLYQKNPLSEREEEVTATLLANNGQPVYRIGGDITYGHPGRVIFPEVPADLIAKPTLVWLLEGKEPGKRQIEATYLTSGITWRADYILTIGRDNRLGDLAGWVTIDNRSGATYRDARLKLVAGTVNRVSDEQPPGRMYKTMMAEAAAPAPQFREEGFFEYHLYTLQRPSTIKENQTKQINLLTAGGIPLRRDLVIRGDQAWYRGPQGGEDGQKQKVGVYVEFDNRQSHQLGMPLPKGTVRVYQQDSDGSLQFIGEDAIGHTPKDEKVRIKVGEAFDVSATRRQTDWKKLASDTYEAGWEVIIRNHKDEDVTVKVLEPMSGDWKVVDSSLPSSKRDAQTAEFNVPVKKDGEAKLVYRVRVRY